MPEAQRPQVIEVHGESLPGAVGTARMEARLPSPGLRTRDSGGPAWGAQERSPVLGTGAQQGGAAPLPP